MKIFPVLSKYNLTFGYKKTPVYKINKNGDFKRYDSISRAANENNVDKSGIARCINGRTSLYLNNVYCAADEIDKQDDIKSAIEKVKNQHFQDNCQKVYAINSKGEVRVFETLIQASDELEIPLTSVHSCSRGHSKSSNGYVFFKKHEVTDENGEFSSEKAEKIANEKFLNSRFSPIYAVDEDGKYKRYDSILDCAQENLIDQRNISNFISHKRRARKGLVFIKAGEVESFKIGQGFIFDEEKLLSLAKKQRFQKKEKIATASKRKTPIYAFFEDSCKPKRFESIANASKEYGICQSRISDCLRGKFTNANNIVFIYADDIEKLDDENNPILDEQKAIETYFDRRDKRKLQNVCEVSPKGEILNTQSLAELRKVIEINKEEYTALNEFGIIEKDGRIFVNKAKVDKFDENGEISFDREKILKLLKENKKAKRKKMIYAVKKDFSYDIFDDTKQAVDFFGAKRANIAMCLSGNSKTALGRVFVYANDVETYDAGNNPYFDYEKFIQVLKDRNCEKQFLNA